MIIGKIVFDSIFKISYSIDDVYEISNLQANDTLRIESGKMVLLHRHFFFTQKSCFASQTLSF